MDPCLKGRGRYNAPAHTPWRAQFPQKKRDHREIYFECFHVRTHFLLFRAHEMNIQEDRR